MFMPSHNTYLFHNIAKLHDSHPDQSVFTSEAVVFDTNMKLVTIQVLLVPNNAVKNQDYRRFLVFVIFNNTSFSQSYISANFP